MDEQTYTNEYRTGPTRPIKNSNGLIALLLICVIFLGGLVSILSLMNIRLFRLLQEEREKTPLTFATGESSNLTPEGDSLTIGGITVQELPSMYQQLYDLPAGLYVVAAPEDGEILPGDVLVTFGGTAVSSLTELNDLRAACKTGESVELSFYRQDTGYFTHTITIE